MTNTLAFKVPNMDCGHCAGTIKTAVEKAHPGAKVDADPKSKRVVVTGCIRPGKGGCDDHGRGLHAGSRVT